ncbi:MAG TPA: hypothetical protein VGV37_15295 [Aliidongia sp.]|uniref:hypothetical protein n=1 Tax=Aliidongia sp. TaxID=1914230 RepID=UPI002DDD99EB|nr:hypothetical protein [Aliidongia sp.]HEV2675885.1 hypothetical protein [Aliidongia sp.]
MTMRSDLNKAVTFWTVLAGVATIALATVVGNLAPTLLPAGSRDALGLVGLGLFLAAHGVAIGISLRRAPEPAAPRAPVALRLVEREA